MSRSAPCAPSNRIRWPARRRSCRTFQAGAAKGRIRGAIRSARPAAPCGPPWPCPGRGAARRGAPAPGPPASPAWRGRRGRRPAPRGGRPCPRSGADSATGRPDPGDRGLRLAGTVQLAVDGQDQRRVLGDHQRVGRDLNALGADRLDLVQQVPRVQHHAVADHRQLAAAHHARGQRVQLVGRAVDDQVWPALCPPWKRQITSARSLSQSTILPLPSSPHWAPTTTTLAIGRFPLACLPRAPHRRGARPGETAIPCGAKVVRAGASHHGIGMRARRGDRALGVAAVGRMT